LPASIEILQRSRTRVKRRLSRSIGPSVTRAPASAGLSFFRWRFGFLGCQRKLADLQRNGCEQQMSQGSPARHNRLLEETCRSRAKPARFKIASFVEKQQTLVRE